MSSEFEWPSQYYFPPFFTIQPNAETRKRQLEIWTHLILKYCRSNKMFILEKTNNNFALFHNPDISRQLSVNSIEAILDDMVTKGHVEWIDPKVKDRCFVFWHSPTEWGNMIYQYAQENGLNKSVATLFELINSEEEFNGMDIHMLIRCLETLVSQDKAEVMGEDGVKFF